LDDREARERVARIDTLLEEVDGLVDPIAQATATELVEALVDIYGEGIARFVAHAAEHDTDGALAEALASDELVSHLLLLHGLHPVPVEERVRRALDEVRPYLDSHGGDVELLGVSEGVAHLRLEGSCDGCPSSRVTLKLAIEDAIRKAAPDLEDIEAEGSAPDAAPPGLVPLPMAGPSWADAGGTPEDGQLVREVEGQSVLFVRLGEQVYAYRPGCPECGGSLALHAAWLECPGCGHHYDVRHAGRCLDAPELHLEPLPLLVGEGGAVKVALGSVT
jgi:Fe-S cluster biogenesis protein NfuA/nitrite reductase/ring-hydroxylating ferredoxin subunit